MSAILEGVDPYLEELADEYAREIPLVRALGGCTSATPGETPIIHRCFKHLTHAGDCRCLCGHRWSGTAP